jgi:GH35 family endo-1,4-beta-xylanase
MARKQRAEESERSLTRREFLTLAAGWAGGLMAQVPLRALAAGADTMAEGDEITSAIRSQIEKARRSQVKLSFLLPSAEPAAGARFEARQVRHRFLFGCALPNPRGLARRLGESRNAAKLDRLFARLFNYATTENAAKWAVVEPEEGKLDYSQVDELLRWCEERSVRLKGHTLVWGTRGEQGVPGWLRERGADEIREILERRVRGVVGRYRGRIKVWDVVNEPLHATWFEKKLGPGYIADAYRWAHEADPSAKLVLNEFGNLTGGDVAFAALAKELLRSGAPIHALGIQAHDPPLWYRARQVTRTLDRLAQVGLPIHITEFTYPSDGRLIAQGSQGVWDEERQARFYARFYTLCFAHPAVEAITMWALWDGSTWLPSGGIVREDWSPKPAYEALDRLINGEWRTSVSGEADRRGAAAFTGFHGAYEITVRACGHVSHHSIEVGPARDDSFALRTG